MPGKIAAIVFSFCIILFLSSSVWGFGSKGNFDKSTSDPNDLRPYTKDNASKPFGQGGYYGGHDTIMGEAAILKKGVHKDDPDSGGERFNLWM